MCLAGACGLWDTGLRRGPRPGPRDHVRRPRRRRRRARGAGSLRRAPPRGARAARRAWSSSCTSTSTCSIPSFTRRASRRRSGCRRRRCCEVLAYVADEATLVGAEITAAAPGYAQVAADAIAPLLEEARRAVTPREVRISHLARHDHMDRGGHRCRWAVPVGAADRVSLVVTRHVDREPAPEPARPRCLRPANNPGLMFTTAVWARAPRSQGSRATYSNRETRSLTRAADDLSSPEVTAFTHAGTGRG